MTSFTHELDAYLAAWPEETRLEAEVLISNVIQWGDAQAADRTHDRDVEQEALDALDTP